MSGLDNLRSVFQDELNEKVELFRQNQPVDKFDTKLNYNDSSEVLQTFGLSADLTQRGGRFSPLLDSVLRGRVYNPIRFSQDFVNDNLFVKPETGEIEKSLFEDQTFDPRATTPKLDTLYFNTNKSFNQATSPTDFSTAIGNNDLPYTPLTELGGQFKENLSWENLYNRDHTPKDDPKYKGVGAVNYGPNVDRDKLNIRSNQERVSIFSPSRTQLFGKGAGEPYMISEISTSDSSTDGGRLSNYGSQEVPIGRALVDAVRLGKYLSSPSGLLFIAKQNLLGLASKSEYPVSLKIPVDFTAVSPQRFNRNYNPLSTLFSAGARLLGPQPNVLFRKDLVGTSYGVTGIDPTDSNPFSISIGAPYDVNQSFIGNGLIDKSTSFPIAAGTKTSQPPGFPPSGDKMTLSSMITGDYILAGGNTNYIQEITETGTTNSKNVNFQIEGEKDGMPFYFKDLRDNTYIFFRAYIEGLTENVSPSYASTNYIGRSEPVYTYERAEREISLTLKLVAQTKDELDSIYEKMERLTSLCYPQYTSDTNGAPDPYGNRMKPPFTKLRYGDLFGGKNNQELMGYIKSISYAVDQSSTYEVKPGKRVPRHVLATIGYQVIHDKAPRLGTKFYGYTPQPSIDDFF
jgi:hypothetical protein